MLSKCNSYYALLKCVKVAEASFHKENNMIFFFLQEALLTPQSELNGLCTGFFSLERSASSNSLQQWTEFARLSWILVIWCHWWFSSNNSNNWAISMTAGNTHPLIEAEIGLNDLRGRRVCEQTLSKDHFLHADSSLFSFSHHFYAFTENIWGYNINISWYNNNREGQ